MDMSYWKIYLNNGTVIDDAKCGFLYTDVNEVILYDSKYKEKLYYVIPNENICYRQLVHLK